MNNNLKTEKLKASLEQMREQSELKNGFPCIRCIECIAPILSEAKLSAKDAAGMKCQLFEIIKSVNREYMEAADYKISESTGKVLKCGYDCINYEEKKEACPFSFYESNPVNIDELFSVYEVDAMNKY